MISSAGGRSSAVFIDCDDNGRVLIVTLLVGDGVAMVSEGLGGRVGLCRVSEDAGSVGEGVGLSIVCCGAEMLRFGSKLSLSPLSLSLGRFLSWVGNSASSPELLRFLTDSGSEDILEDQEN